MFNTVIDTHIIVACGVLHSIAVQRSVPLFREIIVEDYPENIDDLLAVAENDNVTGVNMRNHLVTWYFQ